MHCSIKRYEVKRDLGTSPRGTQGTGILMTTLFEFVTEMLGEADVRRSWRLISVASEVHIKHYRRRVERFFEYQGDIDISIF